MLYKNYLENLNSLYINTPIDDENINAQNDENELNTRIHNKCFLYFNKFTEQFSDIILVTRLINNEYISPPTTKIKIIAELLLGTVGLVIPGAKIFEEMGYHIPFILETGLHVVKEAGEFILKGSHAVHSSSHNICPAIKGKRVKTFIKCLAADLTFRFHREICSITDDQCEVMANKHFEQILDLLQQHAINTPTITADDLLNSIMNLIDPNPDEVIKNLANNYISSRAKRWFRSESLTREEVLKKLKENVEQETPDINQMIASISKNTLFRNDWNPFDSKGQCIAQKQPKLGLENPFMLKIHNDELPRGIVQNEVVTFNKPFFTALFWNHVDLESVCRNITLVLMRWSILKVAQSSDWESEKAREIITKIYQPLETQLNHVNQNVVELTRSNENLTQRVEKLEEVLRSRLNIDL